MTDLYKAAVDNDQPRELESRMEDSMDWGGSRMNPAGPAGTTTHINQNERGILQDGLKDVLSMYHQADLGSDHDQYAQGIYRDTDSRYSD
jgi:hypothetical protein